MFQILILFLSFTFEIYSLSCFVNKDPNNGIACYNDYINKAKEILETCPSDDTTCNSRAVIALNTGAGPCGCDIEIDKLWCNWIDPGRVTQAFQVAVANENSVDFSTKMKICQGYLTHYKNIFADCRGCVNEGGPQFWCKNDLLTEAWCEFNRANPSNSNTIARTKNRL